eukprot:gnl/Dysnectes_brevis/6447_a10011_404.p1 GENE.gnl/Dysnectes_brevis/6447_a10011_404~~gnl/Dysnectes_brevis/6447_a10011_404.p1  ORF type:complete len:522 (+),score=86.49 gnl/Dysnectes_brevis/6447_a10011_404:64-1629(+)
MKKTKTTTISKSSSRRRTRTRSSKRPVQSARRQTERSMTIQQKYDRIADLVSSADHILIGAGAGFSADSGLKTYNDIADVPAYHVLNLTYSDLCVPSWAKRSPELFFGFWGSCYNDYRESTPHLGYQILKKWETMLTSKNGGVTDPEPDKDASPSRMFVYTSNVDGFFERVGFTPGTSLQEVHGSCMDWQCSRGCWPGNVWRFTPEFRFPVNRINMRVQLRTIWDRMTKKEASKVCVPTLPGLPDLLLHEEDTPAKYQRKSEADAVQHRPVSMRASSARRPTPATQATPPPLTSRAARYWHARTAVSGGRPNSVGGSRRRDGVSQPDIPKLEDFTEPLDTLTEEIELEDSEPSSTTDSRSSEEPSEQPVPESLPWPGYARRPMHRPTSTHPRCSRCSAVARPHVLMWDDDEWYWEDDDALRQWGGKVGRGGEKKVLILELGCGTRVPTVRDMMELTCSRLRKRGVDAQLVRVNPLHFQAGELAKRMRGAFLPVKAGGLEALKQIDARISARSDLVSQPDPV